MNQMGYGFGPDITVHAGYAQSANDRLGNIDFIVENTGATTVVVQLREYDADSSPSGWAAVGTPFVVVPGGNQSKSFNLLSKRVAFFGSGSTTISTTLTSLAGYTGAKANITAVIRNKADLRNAQIDMVATGRKNWGYDEGWNKLELKKKWGTITPTGYQAGKVNTSTEGV
jgi:hypothetical protein